MADAILVLFLVALVASGLLVLPVAWWICPSSRRITRATGLEIVDKQGRLRLVLCVDPTGSARVSALDGGGTMRAGLFVRPDGASGLTFWDGEERLRVMVGAASEGTPFVGLWDAADRLRAELSVASDGTPGLSFWDQDDDLRLVLGTRADGVPVVALLNGGGDVLWAAPFDERADTPAHTPSSSRSLFWRNYGCREVR